MKCNTRISTRRSRTNRINKLPWFLRIAAFAITAFASSNDGPNAAPPADSPSTYGLVAVTSVATTNADFVPLASDPRGGDNAYSTFKRLPNGQGVSFGGFSHDRAGNNSVAVYDPKANRWSVTVPNTRWVDGPIINGVMDVSGRTYLGNRDNHNTLVVGSEYWVSTGQRGIDLKGNWHGVLDTKSWRWQINDNDFFPPVGGQLPWWINSAAGWTGKYGYIVGGAKGDNPFDGLARIEPAPGGETPYRIRVWANDSGAPSFAGAEKLRYVSNSHFVRNGKVYVYGGGHEDRKGLRTRGHTLYELDLGVPSMRVFSVNDLQNAVAGEGILADYDPVRDLLIATDGATVNVYDFATAHWSIVPVNTPADPDRLSPSREGAGRQGFYSPESQQYVILGGHGHVYGLRLRYRATAIAPSALKPIVTTASSAARRTIAVTAVPYTGPARVLGKSKHLDFARLGNRWYKLAGDHGDTGSILDKAIPPPGLQDGQQVILSFNVVANDWREDTPYYLPATSGVQCANPDDAFAIAVGDEAWVMNTATNRGALVQPKGAATQVDLTQKICAYSAPSRQWPLGHWRVVGNVPWVINGDRAWRGFHDAATNRIIIPANRNGAVWVMLDATSGADVTKYANGVPYQYGDFIFSVAGAAPDFAKRLFYVYDINTHAIYSASMDNPGVPSKVIDLPEPVQSTQAAIKLTWHPGLRAVIIAATKLHIYEVDSGQLTTVTRPDGFVNGAGKYVPTSTIFYDPDTSDVVSIGTIDWDSNRNPGVYWRLSIH